MEQLNFVSRLEKIAELNPSFATGRLRVCYSGKNRNGSSISKEVLEASIPTMFNCPIVAHYYRDTDSIGAHDLELVIKNNELGIIPATQPVGVVPENDVYFWETVEEEDGTEHEYLVMPIILWKRQEAFDHIAKEGTIAESMECTFDEKHTDADGTVVVDKLTMQAFCLLEAAKPCYESAAIDVFNEQNFKEQFSLMASAWKEACGSESFSIQSFEKGGQDMENENLEIKTEEIIVEPVAEAAPVTEPVEEPQVAEPEQQIEVEIAEEAPAPVPEPQTEEFCLECGNGIGPNTMKTKFDKLAEIMPNKCEYDEATGKVIDESYWMCDADNEYVYVRMNRYYRENRDADAEEINGVGRFKYAESDGEYVLVGGFEPMEVRWLTTEESKKLDKDRAEMEHLRVWYHEYQQAQVEEICESFSELKEMDGFAEIADKARAGEYDLNELKEHMFALKGRHTFALEQEEKKAQSSVVRLDTRSNLKQENKYDGVIFRHYE